MEAEELLDHQRELVGGALRHGRDAPVVDELGVVEETDDGLRVAGVDREEHGQLPPASRRASRSTSRPMSSARAECVIAPTEM